MPGTGDGVGRALCFLFAAFSLLGFFCGVTKARNLFIVKVKAEVLAKLCDLGSWSLKERRKTRNVWGLLWSQESCLALPG